MPDDPVEQLLIRYADGTLTRAEDRELAAAIQADPALRQRLLDDLALAGLLRQLPVGGTEFARALNERIRAESMPSAFADRVQARMKKTSRRGTDRRARRSFSLWPSLAVAASLLLALGIGLWRSRPGLGPVAAHAVIARVESVQGAVSGFADATATEPRPLRPGDEILLGMRIETGADGAATLAWLAEAATVELAASSKLETRSSKRVFLHQGQLTAAVAPRITADLFTIDTPNASAEVLGTRFRLEVRGETGNGKQDARLPAVDAEHPHPSINHQPYTKPSILPFTRLDVEGGLLRFTRLSDKFSIEVPKGHFAVAGASAEEFALKAYPAGTEWIDGRILFEDDFRDGFKHWNLLQIQDDDESGRIEPFTPARGRAIRLATQRRNGQDVQGVLMERKKSSPTIYPLIELKRRLEVPAYSMEWEIAHFFQVLENRVKSGMFFWSISGELVRGTGTGYRGKGEPGTIRWKEKRGELTPLDKNDHEYTTRITSFVNGDLLNVLHAVVEPGKVGYFTRIGRVFVSRCTVRELVRAPSLNRSDGP